VKNRGEIQTQVEEKLKGKRTLFRERVRKIHFVGIGGIGMSGIAEILLDLGYEVTGSDLRSNENTERLTNKGANIFKGHGPENVSGSDVVVHSSAIRDENPEIRKAKDLEIPVIPRAEMLAELMRFNDGIAVAGTHGKTTTTSLMATVLQAGGLDPTVVIGGKLNSLGSNAKKGEGNLMLVEADESDRSFLFLRPLMTCVTNIDYEHMTSYRDMDDLKDCFREFMSSIPFYGFNIVCSDNKLLMEVAQKVHRKIITYGFSKNSNYCATDIKMAGKISSYTVNHGEQTLGTISLSMLGSHNILNSLATVVLGLELGMDFSIIKSALAQFEGVDRRFTIKGEVNEILIVDDYGHHPTEIAATLGGAKQGYSDRKLWAIFQPHRYSRASELFTEFAKAFYGAERVIVSEVYAAGEKPLPGISGQKIAEAISSYSNNATYGGSLEQIESFLLKEVKPGDMIITLGAGSVTQLSSNLINALKSRVKD
jgi:UDP-N-acetylmuramate--alanine ligase